MSPMCLALLGVLALTLVSATAAGSLTGAGKARTCFGKSPTILGTPHRDSIKGTSGRDVIISLGGDDSVRSGQGNDYVCAGSGDDNVHAAEDFNHVNGGPGDDWIDGRRGPGNVVIGGKGADHVQAEGKLDGGSGNDTLESYGYLDPADSPVPDVTDGGSGKDQIYGCGGTPAPQRPATAPGPPRQQAWAWPECYIGGNGNAELLKGGADEDRVFGGGGSDRLQGNGGKDRLYGEDGNDDLNGGSGTDTCRQGPGTGSLTGCP